MSAKPEAQKRQRPTFVHDFAVIERPISELLTRLSETNSELWQCASGTRQSDRVMRLRVGSHSSRFYIAKDVDVTVGEPRQTTDSSIVSLRWAALASPSLFPEMEADIELVSLLSSTTIELVSLLSSTTEVTFMGSYRPPGGALGRTLDRMLLRFVAESSVRCFLASLANTAHTTKSP